ncbi:hypothetical protein CHS0354_033222 [Potamilus streckersoni]|uniref:ENTH domain-containing protein n=1 Tax=Potamilus streckersoni TaxID=2493646 RepID=A0AAE0S659_9BIVA|nr:hypothetical protein CHS0354_033222 [Potamilus streckersoni]
MATTIWSKVSFGNKISTLIKATSDDDRPIPGYLYKEINDMTYESDECCQNTLDFLNDQLDQTSSHVKLKVLKLMKVLVENGHQNFRLGLLKQSFGIKEATKWSGPPDPLHGNTPYLMVRKAAQNLLEVSFSLKEAEPESLTNAENNLSRPPHTTIHTAGMGSTSLAPAAAAGSRARMEGFGNVPFQYDKSIGERLKDSIITMAEKWGEDLTDHQRSILSSIETQGSYTPPPISADLGNEKSTSLKAQPQDEAVKRAPLTKHHIPGRAGGGWEESDDEENAEILPDTNSLGPESLSNLGIGKRLVDFIIKNWCAEEQLVKSWVYGPTGLAPQPSEIYQFVKEASVLNCDVIVKILNDKLKSEDGLSLFRVLLLLEGLMWSEHICLDRLALTCKANLLHVYHSKTGQAKSKARKIIRMLEKLTDQTEILPYPHKVIEDIFQ